MEAVLGRVDGWDGVICVIDLIDLIDSALVDDLLVVLGVEDDEDLCRFIVASTTSAKLPKVSDTCESSESMGGWDPLLLLLLPLLPPLLL